IGILRSAHISNLTDLEQAISSNVPSIVEDFSYTINNPRQEAVHHLLKVNSYHFLKKDEKLEIQYGGQLNDRKEFDIRRTNKDLPALDLTLQSHSLDVSLNRIKGNHKRTVGINNSYQTNRWDPLTGKVPLIPWFNQVNTGTFYISKWSFKQWETELGMRYDYKNVLVKIFNKANTLIRQPYNFHNAAATAGIQYDVNQKVVLSSHLGSAWRPPHVSELFSNGVHHGTATYEKGLLIGDNEDLLPNLGGIKPQPENSLKWITRAMADFNFIKVDASLYNHLINHFIYLAPMPGEFILTSRGAFPVYNYLQTNVYIRGVDGTANVILSKKLDYLFKVSIIQANDRQTGEPLVLIPPGQFENSLQLEFEGGEKVEDIHFSLGSLYVGRQSRVDPLKDFAPVPESYFLLNFHAGYTLLLKKHGLHFYLNIDNLLNTPYRSYMNRLRYFADDLGRNFTIRIKYDFHKHD
ncbi:MAG: TonB-dependent receptor, partial [Cyclobacteriaceae bacterium]|nr:TonB-dependent receptor [Cyclobacteriaceae bacterium]